MTQSERRLYLIKALLQENSRYKDVEIPDNSDEQKLLLRALFNLRLPKIADDEFLKIQNEYLTLRIKEKGITDYRELTPVADGIYLWQGDITTLNCDAIVNAANSQMLGCFCPNHKCIDNAVHTFSGIQLRQKMNDIMQGKTAKTGCAIISTAYNLPCEYIIHTVGPIVDGKLNDLHCDLLSACYSSCLSLADNYGLNSIAFCCISTGEFCFPNDKACEIAINTVKVYKEKTDSKIEVIFNVFKNENRLLYEKRLQEY